MHPLLPLTRILLIDDHAMFRSGLRMVINSGIADTEIFEADSVVEAMTHTPVNVNLILLDIQMHGLSGLDGIALLKGKWPQATILMLSSQDDADTANLVINRGADGFVSKAETADKMVATIHKILQGQINGNNVAANKTTQRQLTPRQRDVLNLLYKGMSNKLIARQLSLSDNTVRRHVQDILEYFQVANRAEAVFAARRQSLV